MRRPLGKFSTLIAGFIVLAITAQGHTQRQDEHSGVITFLVAAGNRQGADSRDLLSELVDRASANKSRPAFIVQLGNITENGSSSQFEAVQAGVKHAVGAGIGVYAVPGGRDVTALANGKDRFTGVFGKTYQSFDLNSAHFVLLDSSVALHTMGHLDKPQLEWLDKDLKRIHQEAPIIVFLYHSVGQQSPQVRPLDNDNELMARLKGHNVVAVFSGDGTGEPKTSINGITMLATPGIRSGIVYQVTFSQLLINIDAISTAPAGPPQHIATVPATVKVKGSLLRVVWDDPDIPYLERRRPAATLSPRAVADNPDKEKAIYRVDEAAWKPLTKDRRDIWTDMFATKDVPVGMHTVDVQLTTSNGQRMQDELIFEVERDNREATRRWALDLPSSIQTSPRLAASTLYVACNDGKLYAVNPENGKRRWSFPAKGAFVASPTVADGAVYIGSTDKTLYAVETTSGRQKWRVELPDAIFGAAAYAKGIVCVAAGDSIYGLDASTSVQRWKQPAGSPVVADIVSDGDAFYLQGLNNRSVVLDAATGSERWHVDVAGSSQGVAAACIVNGRAYIVAGDGNLHCYDAARGVELWVKQAPPGEDPLGTCSPAVCGSSIIVAGTGSHGSVYAFDSKSGDLLWHVSIGQSIDGTGIQPAPNGRTFALMALRGRVTVLDAATGKRLWGYELGPGNIYSTPAYDGRVVYTATMDDDVQAINGPGVTK